MGVCIFQVKGGSRVSKNLFVKDNNDDLCLPTLPFIDFLDSQDAQSKFM
jgi:hypothetical protein